MPGRMGAKRTMAAAPEYLLAATARKALMT
jgi:hypothetical protein